MREEVAISISRLVTTVTRIFDAIINSFGIFALILVFLLVLSTLYSVVMRYFLGHAELWVLETTEYCLLFITFLATTWLLKEEGHIKMDVLLNRFKPKNQAKISTFTSIIGAFMFLVITWYSAKVVWRTYQTGYTFPSVLDTPGAPILSIITVGSLLLFIQFVRRAYGYFRRWKA